MISNDTKVNLIVTAEEFNILMAGLEELPHKISRKLIDNLAGQVGPQIEAAKQQG